MNKQNPVSVGEDVEKIEALCVAGGHVKQRNRCEKQLGNSLEN